MPALRFKPIALRLYLGSMIFFIVNKFALRPFVLEHDSPHWLRIFVLSVPNTIEAVCGTLTLSALLIVARNRRSPRFDHISDAHVYLLATLLGGIYVITQEMKFHNLGGRNVYDPLDVVASLIGLAGTFFILLRFGILEDWREHSPSHDSV